MNIAIILAGGVGSRLDETIPKQFIKIAGKMVIEHTIDVFEQNKNINEIAIVSNENYIYELEKLIIKNKWIKVKKIIKGGNERYLSSLSAIRAYELSGCNNKLIFHDAVRPLVSNRIINDVITALSKYNAVDVAIPSTDTIIKVYDNRIIEIPDRNNLMRGQTPQGFRYNTIKKAYEKALKDKNLKTTDDCGIIKKYLPSEKIFVVKGDDSNMKLTYKEDIFLLDKLFQLRYHEIQSKSRLKNLRKKVIIVFGGSSGIGKDIVNISKRVGAKVYPFSRSLNGVDIRNIENINKALNMVFRKEKRIDFIINTAAIMSKEPLIHMKSELIDNIIATNYCGNINIARASFEYLKESSGHLLLFTSSSYTRGREFYSIYSSTKASVVNFVQAISEEWRPFNIHVNCINPERTNTPMRVKNFGMEPEQLLLKSSDVAKICLKVLLSDLNGQIIYIRK